MEADSPSSMAAPSPSLDSSLCDTSGFGTDDSDEDEGVWSLQMEQAMASLNEMCYNCNAEFESVGAPNKGSEVGGEARLGLNGGYFYYFHS